MIETAFTKMGARAKVSTPRTSRFDAPNRWDDVVRFNVLRDEDGEFFDISAGKDVDLKVLEVRPADRHLLMLAVTGTGKKQEKSRFLMGHDERHWFVAAVPENKPVSTVKAAMQALKPTEVVEKERTLKAKSVHRRKTKARVRQGEWFFVPDPNFKADPRMIMKNEPIRRGNGKAHMCQELVRFGGETVYVSSRHTNGLTQKEYDNLSAADRGKTNFQIMRRNPKVYVRGTVRHSDHKTIKLGCWHEVLMNTETKSRAMMNVAFLD